MKRDMDLARAILLVVEASETDPGVSVPMNSLVKEGYSDKEISYQIKLLAQAGLIEARDDSTLSGTSWCVKSLTWEGHDFLDAARNETIWKKGKQVVLDNTGGLTFETLKGVLIQLGKSVALSALSGEFNISP